MILEFYLDRSGLGKKGNKQRRIDIFQESQFLGKVILKIREIRVHLTNSRIHEFDSWFSFCRRSIIKSNRTNVNTNSRKHSFVHRFFKIFFISIAMNVN